MENDKETWVGWDGKNGEGGEFRGKFERLTKRVVKRVDNCYVERARVN